MGYTNPQRIIDRSFDEFTNASKRWVGQVARTSAEIEERNRVEKEQQAKQWEKDNEEQQLMYSKVNEVGSTGNSALDENLRGFWNDKTDQYFEIKNLMDNQKVSQADGNKQLAKLMGDVDKFQAMVPYLAEQTALQKEHGKIEPGTAGAISSVTPGESQDIFNNIMTGGNTALVDKGGVMYMYNPPIPGQQAGGMINIDELLAKKATGEDIVQLVPDISGDLSGAYKNIYNPDDIDSEYVTTISENRDDGYTYTYKKYIDEKNGKPFDAKEYGITQMIDNGQFDPLVANEKEMMSVWQDMMPDEITGDTSWHQTDPTLTGPNAKAQQEAAWAKQEEQAKRWLAEQAYDKNSELDQGKLKYLHKKRTQNNNNNNNNNSNKPKKTGVIVNTKATSIPQTEFNKKGPRSYGNPGDQVWVTPIKTGIPTLITIS